MSAPWTGTRRGKAYNEAAWKHTQAQAAWEEFIREDAYRTAARMVRDMYPDRPELKDLLGDIANKLEGEE